MRHFKPSVTIDLGAAKFWLLNQNPDFCKFCAEQDGVTSYAEARDFSYNAQGEEMVTCRTVTTVQNPLPTALVAVLGSRDLEFVCTTTWIPSWYDQDHAAIFETRIPALRGSSVRGECWLEEIAEHACVCTFDVRLEAKLPVFGFALERLIEQVGSPHTHWSSYGPQPTFSIFCSA